jgi:hypothetical protein
MQQDAEIQYSEHLKEFTACTDVLSLKFLNILEFRDGVSVDIDIGNDDVQFTCVGYNVQLFVQVVPRVHVTHEDFPHPGAWTVVPLLSQ